MKRSIKANRFEVANRCPRAPWLAFLLSIVWAQGAVADIITYRFSGSVLEAPPELSDLAYGGGPGSNPLVFTLVVNSAIPANYYSSTSAEYLQSVISTSVELGGVTLATSDTARVIITEEYFQGDLNNPAAFTSGPVLGLTPRSLQFNLISAGPSFATPDFPDPFPSIGYPFQVTDFYLRFTDLSSQPLYSILQNVSTTTVIPVPAGLWLLISALGGLGFLRRR